MKLFAIVSTALLALSTSSTAYETNEVSYDNSSADLNPSYRSDHEQDSFDPEDYGSEDYPFEFDESGLENTCGNRCRSDSNCRKGGFDKCGRCIDKKCVQSSNRRKRCGKNEREGRSNKCVCVNGYTRRNGRCERTTRRGCFDGYTRRNGRCERTTRRRGSGCGGQRKPGCGKRIAMCCPKSRRARSGSTWTCVKSGGGMRAMCPRPNSQLSGEDQPEFLNFDTE